MNQPPKSVVREIRTPRSVGTGGGRLPPVTRWARGNSRPYRDRRKFQPPRQLLTLSVTFPPSIDALQKVSLPVMLGAAGRLQLLAGREHGQTIH